MWQNWDCSAGLVVETEVGCLMVPLNGSGESIEGLQSDPEFAMPEFSGNDSCKG